LCKNATLTEVPSGVAETFITLDVSYNNISHLTATSFSNKGMSQLTSLYIYNNAIRNIDHEAFKNLTKLKSIFLGMNKIMFIHRDTFVHNTKLEEIDLHGNNINLGDEGPFYNLVSLRVLNLADCNLTSIPKGAFQKTVNLSRLDVSKNKLTYIDDHLFDNLTSLKFLNLSANLLTSVDFLLVMSTTTLQKISLYIYNNRLDNVKDEVLKRMGYLNNLYIHQNPFLCSCWDRNCSKYIKGWETHVESCLNQTTSAFVTKSSVTTDNIPEKPSINKETPLEVPEIQRTSISFLTSHLNFTHIDTTDVTDVPIQQESSRNLSKVSVIINVSVPLAIILSLAIIVAYAFWWIKNKKQSASTENDSVHRESQCDICPIYENYTPNCDHKFWRQNTKTRKRGGLNFATQSTLETYETVAAGENEEYSLCIPINEEASRQDINSNHDSVQSNLTPSAVPRDQTRTSRTDNKMHLSNH
jgi:Leucine-rich repeat (LRR) protein